MGTFIKQYRFNGQLIALREGLTNSDPVSFLAANQLGSTTTTLWADDTVRADLRYTPWGEERWASNATPTQYQYTSQRNDSTLGLYDYNARYYDPAIGRFISADSIVPNPGSLQAFNRYAYVENQPVNFNDPSGHCKPGQCLVVGGSGGPITDSSYTKLFAKILVDFIVEDQEIRKNSDSDVGIVPFDGMTIEETLWDITNKDTNEIVDKHDGDSEAALKNYDRVGGIANIVAIVSIQSGNSLRNPLKSLSGEGSTLGAGNGQPSIYVGVAQTLVLDYVARDIFHIYDGPTYDDFMKDPVGSFKTLFKNPSILDGKNDE